MNAVIVGYLLRIKGNSISLCIHKRLLLFETLGCNLGFSMGYSEMLSGQSTRMNLWAVKWLLHDAHYVKLCQGEASNL